MKTEDRFAEISAFVATVRHQSFALAAQAMTLSSSAVSRRVSALEARLGVRLLTRTTRSLRLTEAGEHYYADCRRLLAEMDAADQSLRDAAGAVSGRLKLALPVSYGHLHVLPTLPGFMRQYPEVELDVSLSDRYVNIVEENVDLAVRIGKLVDSSLVAKRLRADVRRICATPAYLAEHGTPATPAELTQHRVLQFSLTPFGDVWQLTRRGKTESVKIRPRLWGDSAQLTHAAALAGQGIAIVPAFLAAADIAEGRLQVILPEWKFAPTGIWAVYPGGRHLPLKVRKLIAYLEQHLPVCPYDLGD
ncbi:LysR family transcriptional regulator [Massilia sp. YIM B04103]|uniref:LysR family transcriptional regulator n=1 Tax=Massilia sp. YIM B04103 TaxID=2963106 RepID=UPI00210D223B|nr:LysR family transcriptional regulator [Massilia sp. YIM B04103]